MPDVAELGRLVKAKYPEYASMDDAEVGRRVRAKYPEYRNFTDTKKPAPLKGEVHFGSQDLAPFNPMATPGVEIQSKHVPGAAYGTQDVANKPVNASKPVANTLIQDLYKGKPAEKTVVKPSNKPLTIKEAYEKSPSAGKSERIPVRKITLSDGRVVNVPEDKVVGFLKPINDAIAIAAAKTKIGENNKPAFKGFPGQPTELDAAREFTSGLPLQNAEQAFRGDPLAFLGMVADIAGAGSAIKSGLKSLSPIAKKAAEIAFKSGAADASQFIAANGGTQVLDELSNFMRSIPKEELVKLGKGKSVLIKDANFKDPVAGATFRENQHNVIPFEEKPVNPVTEAIKNAKKQNNVPTKPPKSEQLPKKPVEAPAEIPVQPAKVNTSTPKTTPKVETPVTDANNTVKGVTGLANQVQDKEIAAGLMNDVEKSSGKGAEHWQQTGKKMVDEGEDYELLATQIAKDEVEPSATRFGILTEGKRLLRIEVDKRAKAVAAAKTAKEKRIATEALLDAEDRLQEFAQNVQVGKGKWSDAGRALQAGTTLDEGSYADILEYATRTGDASPKLKAQLKRLSEQVSQRDQTIVDLRNQVKEAQANGAVQAAKGRKYNKVAIQDEIDEIYKEFEKLNKNNAPTTKQTGAILISKEDAAKRVALIKRLAVAHIKMGAATLEDVVIAVQKGLHGKFGIQIDKQEVIDSLAPGTGRTRTDIENKITQLRAQAKRESTASIDKLNEDIKKLQMQISDRSYETTTKTKAELSEEIANLQKERAQLTSRAKRESNKNLEKIYADIENLKKQLSTGDFHLPSKKEVEVSQALKDAEAERAVYANDVRRALAQHRVPAGHRIAREITGDIRALILGGDLGIVGRQGLFAWAHPASAFKATGAAIRAAGSEAAEVLEFAKIRDARMGDGKLARPIQKQAGLQLTDNLSTHEEILISRFLGWAGKGAKNVTAKSSVPLIKKAGQKVGNAAGSLERFQRTWINSARADVFNRSYNLTKNARELEVRASYINNASGRGNIKHVPIALEVMMTSPRYESSRWGTMWEVPKNLGILTGTSAKSIVTKKGLGGVNRGALLNVISISTSAAELYGMVKLAELAGYTWSWDEMALRKGNKVWKVGAGIDVRIRDIMKMINIGINRPTYNQNLGTIAKDVVTRTVSPAIRTPIEQANIANQRYRQGISEENLKGIISGMPLDDREKFWYLSISPLIVSSTTDFWNNEGYLSGLDAALKEFFGQSANRYPKKTSTVEPQQPVQPTKPKKPQG